MDDICCSMVPVLLLPHLIETEVSWTLLESASTWTTNLVTTLERYFWHQFSYKLLHKAHSLMSHSLNAGMCLRKYIGTSFFSITISLTVITFQRTFPNKGLFVLIKYKQTLAYNKGTNNEAWIEQLDRGSKRSERQSVAHLIDGTNLSAHCWRFFKVQSGCKIWLWRDWAVNSFCAKNRS